MKKNLLLFFIFSGLMMLSVSAQKTSKKSEKNPEAPKDFPQYPKAESDAQNEINYLIAVKEWIRNHPDEYTNFTNIGVDILQFRSEYASRKVDQNTLQVGSNNQQTNTPDLKIKTVMTKAEFDALPQHKKDYYTANPDLIEIK